MWLFQAAHVNGFGACQPKERSSEHQHATEGPHGGELLELGSEEFHVEFLHDEKNKTLTLYILDGEAKQAVPIDSPQLTINLTHDGQAEQFAVPASPESSDPQGKSSRFQSNDAELNEDLEIASGEPQLVVQIAGKQYRAAIHHAEHDHPAGEHEGHEHKE